MSPMRNNLELQFFEQFISFFLEFELSFWANDLGGM